MKFVTWRDMEDGGDENGPNDSDALSAVSFAFLSCFINIYCHF